MLMPDQMITLRGMIDRRREVLLAELHEDAARSRSATFGELAGPGADSGDMATADVISDTDHAALSRDLQELRALDAAGKRIDGGSYGKCIDCGGGIVFERLLAQPAATRCMNCQQTFENTHTHPAQPKM
ncbi:MAG: TraR/DksA family transcriptional regulator [Burkholderiales bacterium]